MKLSTLRASLALALTIALPTILLALPAELQIVSDWEIRVKLPADPGSGRPVATESVFNIPPTRDLEISAERHDRLPIFNPKAGGWVKGAQLRGVRAQETTTPFLLDPKSVIVRGGPEPSSMTFAEGTDYLLDGAWGTIGRKEGGRIAVDQAVYVSYRYTPLRLDAIVRTATGRLEHRTGEPKSAAPKPPELQAGEERVGTVWLPGKLSKLSPEHLFPVLEQRFPETTKVSPTLSESLLPKTMSRLKSRQPLRILAWGDSVTDGGYVPQPEKNRWQEQFVARLRQRFPESPITLISEAWGGRNTDSYLAEPPGSVHNYQEKVLAVKPDLIVSEFVNDAWMNPAQVEERYARLLTDFRTIGAEWIILTPHYVRPDWMGLNRERDIDEDPRPYVAGLREFSKKHGVPLAEGSKRYGRLWRQGIPYTTVMLNSINHPDAFGMGIFADALMELFP